MKRNSFNRHCQRITLNNVAEKASVSLSTVSKVLNDRPDCWASEATRRRIRSAAEELGYRPNLAARGLRSGRSRVVGLVSPGFHTSAIHSRPGSLNQAAAEADYTVTLISHPNNSDAEDHVIQRLLDRGVDGMVVYPVDRGPHRELKRLVEHGFPIVTFDGAVLLDFECDDISNDYGEIARIQVRHLLDISCQRICIVRAIPEARINVIRNQWIHKELRSAGAPAPLVMTIHRKAHAEIPDPESTFAEIGACIRRHAGSFDAIVSYDSIASLVIRGLLENGLRVPDDISVIGVGDSMIASYGVIPLTSVETQNEWTGAKAFELLLSRIHGKAGDRYIRLTAGATLVERKSTRPASGA